jgi:hypothetical protein
MTNAATPDELRSLAQWLSATDRYSDFGMPQKLVELAKVLEIL